MCIANGSNRLSACVYFGSPYLKNVPLSHSRFYNAQLLNNFERVYCIRKVYEI